MSVAYNYSGAVITIVNDDGAVRLLTELQPILNRYSIKSSLGIITDNVVYGTNITLEQLKMLQGEDLIYLQLKHEVKI